MKTFFDTQKALHPAASSTPAQRINHTVGQELARLARTYGEQLPLATASPVQNDDVNAPQPVILKT